MQINIKNGTLTLGSVYKLIFAGWFIGWGAFMAFIFCLTMLVSFLSGSLYVNGEEIRGAGSILVSFIPFVVLLPIILFFHALMFSGLLTLGVWLYRKLRPITVVNHDPALPF